MTLNYIESLFHLAGDISIVPQQCKTLISYNIVDVTKIICL